MKYAFLTPASLEWLETIEKLSHDFYHLPEYLTLNASFEKGEACAFVAKEGTDILFFPFIVRPVVHTFGNTEYKVFYDAISPYGYSPLLISQGSPNEFYYQAFNVFCEEMRRKNIIAVFSRLHPILPIHEKLKHHGALVLHGSTVSINLGLSEQEIWCQIRRNYRYEIKRTQALGYKFIVDDDWTYWEQFLAIYYETMQRNKAEDYYYFSPQYFESLKQTMRQHLRLAVILDKNEVASAGIFAEVNGIVQYHFSATADTYLKSGSSKTLLYFMALWEKQRGNNILHLGGGIGGQEDSLFNFKAGFSGSRHPFYTWRFVTNEEVYLELVDVWVQKNGKPADDIYGFFPAYRKCNS